MRGRNDALLATPTATNHNMEMLSIGATRHWLVALRPKQITLGSCLIAPLRPVRDLDELTSREAKDMLKALQAFQILTRGQFQPTRFNYVLSGQRPATHGERDEVLHFHAFPRYDSDREFADKLWVDERWPLFLTFPEKSEEPLAKLREIRSALRKQNQARRILNVK